MLAPAGDPAPLKRIDSIMGNSDEFQVPNCLGWRMFGDCVIVRESWQALDLKDERKTPCEQRTSLYTSATGI